MNSVDDLVVHARCADPPVSVGDCAVVILAHRRVLLECVATSPFIEWREVSSYDVDALDLIREREQHEDES